MCLESSTLIYSWTSEKSLSVEPPFWRKPPPPKITFLWNSGRKGQAIMEEKVRFFFWQAEESGLPLHDQAHAFSPSILNIVYWGHLARPPLSHHSSSVTVEVCLSIFIPECVKSSPVSLAVQVKYWSDLFPSRIKTTKDFQQNLNVFFNGNVNWQNEC